MSEVELLALVEEILEVPSGTVSVDSDLEDLGWDSLSNLTLLSIADERYHARIDPRDLADASTPGELGELFTKVSSK